VDLLLRAEFQRFLTEHHIGWDDSGYGHPDYRREISAFRQHWHTETWHIKSFPRLVSVFMDALGSWDYCLLAKCRLECSNPFFHFDEECPVLRADCLVTPESVGDRDTVDDCNFFDSFCLDHWPRYDAVHNLLIPNGFPGALRFPRHEADTVQNIMLLTLYSRDPWNDLMLFPDTGQHLITLRNEDRISVVYREAVWGVKLTGLLAANGFV